MRNSYGGQLILANHTARDARGGKFTPKQRRARNDVKG
jgi:hypothetical protein